MYVPFVIPANGYIIKIMRFYEMGGNFSVFTVVVFRLQSLPPAKIFTLCARSLLLSMFSSFLLSANTRQRPEKTNKKRDHHQRGNKSHSFARVDFILMIAGHILLPARLVFVSERHFHISRAKNASVCYHFSQNIYLRFYFFLSFVFYRLPSRYQPCESCRIWSKVRELCRCR